MKTNKYILITFSVLIIALSSCSIDKRIHRTGYHIESFFSKNNSINKANEKNVLACSEKPEISENKKEIIKNECVGTKEIDISTVAIPEKNVACNTIIWPEINLKNIISPFIEKGISSFNNRNTLNYVSTYKQKNDINNRNRHWTEYLIDYLIYGVLLALFILSFKYLIAKIILITIVGAASAFFLFLILLAASVS